jgi:hypothetical protein
MIEFAKLGEGNYTFVMRSMPVNDKGRVIAFVGSEVNLLIDSYEDEAFLLNLSRNKCLTDEQINSAIVGWNRQCKLEGFLC